MKKTPWRTIQKAADVMEAGDCCIVHAGVYRESIRPYRSGTVDKPIRFVAAEGDKVLITGTETVANWSVYAGHIHKATVDWAIEQVFVNRKLVTPARWPNAGDNPYELKLANVAIDSGGYVFDAPTGPKDTWKGGYLWGMNSREWVAQTVAITASDGRTAKVEGKGPIRDKGRAYLFGTLDALDVPGEWFQKDGLLYLWKPRDENGAAENLIEVTKRRWAFDLSHRSHIDIDGFEIFAASINLDKAEDCKIERCRIQFASFDRVMKGGFNRDRGIDPDSEGLGIVLGGNDNVVCDSVVAYCIGDGISVYGLDNRIENCVVHDCDISASDCAPINCTGTGHSIIGCTIFNSGRSGIVHRKLRRGRIAHNHIYNIGLITNDLGATYTFQTDGDGTVIAYNRVHDVHCHTGVGIYVDNFSPNHIVHHNLCYNNEDCGIRLNTPTSHVQIYNNTLTRNGRSIAWWGRDNNSKQDGTIVVNNIMTDAVSLGSGATESNNFTGNKPGFKDSDSNDFRLVESSPCIDAGKIIGGITPAFSGGAPDIGCYEYGAESWKAGSNLSPYIWNHRGW